MADERGLEGDDGHARREGVGDLGGDGETVGGDHALRVRRVIHAAHPAAPRCAGGASLVPCSMDCSRDLHAPRPGDAPPPGGPRGARPRAGRDLRRRHPAHGRGRRTTWRTAGSCRSTAGSRASSPRGTVRDKAPAISPDGRRLAFRRRVPGTAHDYRLLILDLAGGEPWEPALDGMSVDELAWSPDGRSIAFAAATGRTAVHRRSGAGHRRAAGEAHHGPRLPLGRGRLPRPALAGLRRRGRAGRRAAPGDRRRRAASPGSRGGRTGRRSRSWRIRAPTRTGGRGSSIWEVAVEGDASRSPPREILALAGPVSRPAYSPDGRWIAGVGVDDPDFFDDLSPTLFVGPADGSAPAVGHRPGPGPADRELGGHGPHGLDGGRAPGTDVGRGRNGDRRARHGPRPDAPVALRGGSGDRRSGRRPGPARTG